MVLLYLEDDQVKPSDIDEIKESVEYYIDENAEPDFVEDELVFDNLIRKAEEAAKYDDFEDIEDEVVIEGNVIQPLPANAEPVAVPIKNEEIEVLKIMDNNAAKLKEKQEKEKQEQLEKEKQEELDKQQRLEQDKIEQEKKAAAKAAASMNAPKKAATTTPTLTTTPTPAAITKTAPANKPAAKQPKQQKAAIKTKPQLITAPKKLQIQPQELNFSSVVAAAAAQSPTKQAQSASIAIKQPAMKPPAQISSKVVSYSEVINPGPTQLVSVGDENKGITPRSATSGASATPITQSVFEQELITFNKNELSDITIQTFSSPTKSILSNKDKKLVPGNIPHVMNAGHVGQNIQNLQSFGQESEKNNEETFGNLSVDGIASLEDMSSRTQETSQAFQMEMPVQSFAQQPISSSNIVLNVTPGVSHVESMSVPMTNMMSMGGSVGTNVGLNFSQSPPPTMPSAATTSLLKPESRDLKSRMLNASLNNLPHPLDCERPRQYIPMNPFDTPAIFPQEQLPILKNPALFNTMDPDTLFFIFYFQQGTYQQYLAAKALKKLAWRYHKKYQTWFQRHEQPKQTTNEYELGTYVYFDYEQDWCQRIKSGFRFEYEYLEDAIL
jgi:CCR4-NOT transcriptional regulation complex NOT5 subunit